jgi:hypothetical protein
MLQMVDMVPLQVTEVQSRGLSQLLPRGLHTSCRSFAAGGDVTLDLEHATGLERYIIQGLQHVCCAKLI